MQTSGTTAPLTDVCFVDQNTGWISGWTGTILHTDDGGANWVDQDAPPTNAYFSVYFTDDLNGWACGYAGRIIHTSDGGQTWEIQTSTTNDDLYSIYFVDNMNGWAVGGSYGSFPSYIDTRKIIYTNDGGSTWTLQYGETYKQPLKKITFVDQDHGFCTGDDGILMSTNDAGDNWTETTINSSFQFVDLCFTNTNTGWVCGEYLGLPHYGTIFKTTDGGNTWTESQLDTDEHVTGLFFIDSNYGWALASNYGDDNVAVVLKTIDGGESWTPETLPDNVISLSEIFFADTANGWAVGNLGTIVSTYNGTVGISEENDIQIHSQGLVLQNNYPNPFNSQTKIDIQIPESAKVSLKIYNLTGQMVKVLIDRVIPAGSHTVTWDGNNDAGQNVNSGLYFYRLNAGGEIQTKRMSLVR